MPSSQWVTTTETQITHLVTTSVRVNMGTQGCVSWDRFTSPNQETEVTAL